MTFWLYGFVDKLYHNSASAPYTVCQSSGNLLVTAAITTRMNYGIYLKIPRSVNYSKLKNLDMVAMPSPLIHLSHPSAISVFWTLQ